MPVALTLCGVEKSYGVHEVLTGVDLMLDAGGRLGIVGPNGCGKSTLLNVIAGQEAADGGNCALGRGARLGYLRQETVGKSELPVWEELLRVFEPVLEMERTLRELEARMGELHDRDPQGYARCIDEYDRLTRRFEERGGYRYRSDMQGVLAGLGFGEERYGQRVNTLSGGERTRLALAKLLLEKPEVLLLDEPTNHLDMASVEWLEGMLKTYPGALIIVSHDRYFLDALATQIAELEGGKLTLYQGNYTEYVRRSEERRRQKQREYDLYIAEVERQEKIIERFRSFNREKSIRAAESREKALARMEVVEKPVSEKPLAFSFSEPAPTGQDVLTVAGLAKAFNGRPLFSGLGFRLRAGDRVALIGRNGVGKSTVLKILAGMVEADEGAYLFGARVSPGYFDQQQDTMNEANSVLDEVWQVQPRLSQTQVRSLLGSFQFRGDEVFQPIGTLSGGERGRVALCKLLLTRSNLLLLDEPTNHLDMGARQALEEALANYTGTLLTVSHDRYFINRVANRVLVLEEDGLTGYLGNYDSYLEQRRRAQAGEADAGPQLTKTEKREQNRRERLGREARKRLRLEAQAAEAEVLRIEGELERLAGELADPDGERVRELSAAYGELEAALPPAYERWERAQTAWEQAKDEG